MAADAFDMSPFLDPLMCANTEQKVDGEMSPCQEEATLVCSKCKLVQYCSKACQTEHWKAHKLTCKSKYLADQYVPGWTTDGRIPAFMYGPSVASFGSLQYFWGNVPALDLMQVASNEGESSILHENITMLFAASGDLRNVVKTVNGMPGTYSGDCSIVINDKNFAIAARNAMLLLTALHFEPAVASPIMLHLWYSAMLPKEMITALQEVVLPCISDVCEKIKNKPEHSFQAKTFRFGQSSVRLTFKKYEWFALGRMFLVPEGLTESQAQTIRHEVILARKDHIDRALLHMPPGRRAGMMKFREGGVLLPFGASCTAFSVPNPTFFQGRLWPMKDNADPLDGWTRAEYMKCAPAAKDDIYGALFFYLRDVLREFCTRVRSFRVSFQLLAVDATVLPAHLESLRFDRIEVSNICDRYYVGPAGVLAAFATMLKTKSENPHATLLMLFLNIVTEEENHVMGSDNAETTKKMHKYMDVELAALKSLSGRRGFQDRNKMKTSPEFVRVATAKQLLDDFDTPFQKFLDHVEPGKGGSMNALARKYGAKIKPKHTIIERWPYRITDETTKEEFKIMLSEGTWGQERYMEFGKADE